MSQTIGICSKIDSKEGRCYGGFARIASVVRRARVKNSQIPTFYFNAGDTFAGTYLYQYFKWEVVTKFLNILAPDAVVSICALDFLPIKREQLYLQTLFIKNLF